MSFLARFPNTAFGPGLGFGGLAIMARAASLALRRGAAGGDRSLSSLSLSRAADVFMALAGAVFVTAGSLFLAKATLHLPQLQAEFKSGSGAADGKAHPRGRRGEDGRTGREEERTGERLGRRSGKPI